RGERCRIFLPDASRRGDEERACVRAELAMVDPRIGYGRAPARALVAEAPLGRGLREIDRERHLLDAHLVPAHVELLRDHHRKRGLDPLVDRETWAADKDPVAALDAEEVPELGGARLRARGLGWHADDHGAARAERHLQEFAPVHAGPPIFFAAATMARRTRGYVPQRQRFVIVATSASVGRGFF